MSYVCFWFYVARSKILFVCYYVLVQDGTQVSAKRHKNEIGSQSNDEEAAMGQNSINAEAILRKHSRFASLWINMKLNHLPLCPLDFFIIAKDIIELPTLIENAFQFLGLISN